MHAVESLGYRPNRLAAAFKSDKASTLVGVCVPRLTSGMFGSVLDSVDHTLSRLGYQTIIGSHEQVPETEEAWLATILSWRPAGVILSGRKHTRTVLDMLREQAVPVVEIWNLNTSPIDISVGFNHYDCGHEMGRYMVSKGCRYIAYVGAEANTPGMGMIRLDGFRDALAEGGAQLATAEILIDRPGFYAGFYGTETILNRTGGGRRHLLPGRQHGRRRTVLLPVTRSGRSGRYRHRRLGRHGSRLRSAQAADHNVGRHTGPRQVCGGSAGCAHPRRTDPRCHRRADAACARQHCLNCVYSPLPQGAVMSALLVDPLEAVGAEIVALSLNHVGGGTTGAQDIEIIQRGAERRGRQALLCGKRATVVRRSACVCLSRSAKKGANMRLTSGCAAKAVAISFSIADRMMQPARQTLAISGIGSFHSFAWDSASNSSNPWA